MGNHFPVTGFLPFMVGITVVLGVSADLYLKGCDYHWYCIPDLPLHKHDAATIAAIAFQLRNFQNATAGIWRIHELMRQKSSVPEKTNPLFYYSRKQTTLGDFIYKCFFPLS